jgi:CO dehydrogenase/acetyl-CoA synthase delta subunit
MAVSVCAVDVVFRVNPKSVSVLKDANSPLVYEVAIAVKDDERVLTSGVNEHPPF